MTLGEITRIALFPAIITLLAFVAIGKRGEREKNARCQKSNNSSRDVTILKIESERSVRSSGKRTRCIFLLLFLACAYLCIYSRLIPYESRTDDLVPHTRLYANIQGRRFRNLHYPLPNFTMYTMDVRRGDHLEQFDVNYLSAKTDRWKRVTIIPSEFTFMFL